jgi:hypothetical protein
MRLYEISNSTPLKNPFTNSLIKEILFHGTTESFSKFIRKSHGIYVTPFSVWASSNYGNTHLISLYANVTKLLKLDPGSYDVDMFYDRDYAAVTEKLIEWSTQGYNCCQFGGESDSMVLFNNIELVNAYTGAEI